MVPSLQSNGGTSIRGNKADTAAQCTSAEALEAPGFITDHVTDLTNPGWPCPSNLSTFTSQPLGFSTPSPQPAKPKNILKQVKCGAC